MIAIRPPDSITPCIFSRKAAFASWSARCSRKLETKTPSKWSAGSSASMIIEVITRHLRVNDNGGDHVGVGLVRAVPVADGVDPPGPPRRHRADELAAPG